MAEIQEFDLVVIRIVVHVVAARVGGAVGALALLDRALVKVLTFAL